jgi:hypothetical protein
MKRAAGVHGQLLATFFGGFTALAVTRRLYTGFFNLGAMTGNDCGKRRWLSLAFAWMAVIFAPSFS